VARRFRGEFDQKVDAKGRVSIPAQFRRVIEEGDPDWDKGKQPEFVIVYGDHRRKFLECYTIKAIEEVDAKIARLPRRSPQRQAMELLFNGQSLETSVDADGRIVLPQRLREKIGIGPNERAYFIGTGDTFQIWKPETFDREQRARTEEWLNQFPEDFDPLQLLDELAGDDGEGGA
jgi:MraZ protein